jgi:hypothetical protein
MKADLTRNTHHALRHYAQVLMQQGRVQLDADWNEQSAILLRYLRTLAADLIGGQGGPLGHSGFGLSTGALTPSGDFQIGLGRYYVDGILCEADAPSIGFVPQNGNVIVVDQWTLGGTPFRTGQLIEIFENASSTVPTPSAPAVFSITNVDPIKQSLTLQTPPPTLSAPRLRRVYTYLTQPDYPVPDAEKITGSGNFIVYLDVWERLITYLEVDEIREVALLGPDTAARTQVVWQVKATPASSNGKDASPCDSYVPTDTALLARLRDDNRGLLRARAKQSALATDPCIASPDASFRGHENQLYRVEIHRGGGAWDGSDSGKSSAATFKWSRDNGSIAFPIVALSSGGGVTTVTLGSLGRDERLGLAEGQWVELQDDTSVLQNRAENLLQVQGIDRARMTVTLAGTPGSAVGTDATRHPLLRRWDQQQGDPAEGGLELGSDGAALVFESSDAWVELEDGVQIQFCLPEDSSPLNLYRTADYWLIPARTATGDLEWPSELGTDADGNPSVVPLAKPPDGVEHHYAQLGVLSVTGGNVTVASDCRKSFGPVAS